MIENLILEYLPAGISIIDFLLILIILIFLILLFNFIGKLKISREIKNIPGYELNRKVISDIANINKRLSEFSVIHHELKLEIDGLEKKTKKIKTIKSIKYNPYQDMGVGGKQSFSTIIIDEDGNGLILTSLYSRDRTRVLLKEIQNYQATQELAPEEKELLNSINSK